MKAAIIAFLIYALYIAVICAVFLPLECECGRLSLFQLVAHVATYGWCATTVLLALCVPLAGLFGLFLSVRDLINPRRRRGNESSIIKPCRRRGNES